jgi:hypothetical protein
LTLAGGTGALQAHFAERQRRFSFFAERRRSVFNSIGAYGLWEYMPYYRVGRLCSWDIDAMVLLGVVVWRFLRPRVKRT